MELKVFERDIWYEVRAVDMICKLAEIPVENTYTEVAVLHMSKNEYWKTGQKGNSC